MNKYGQILDLLRTYDYLGKEEYPDGAALIGKAPHIAPLAWLHKIYAPLSNGQIQQLEATLRVKIPEDYEAFLKVSNGLGVFQKMNLYGYRSNYQRTVEAAQVQPFDILRPNIWERPSNAGPHVFYIGGYTAGNGAWIYLDANDNTVHLCERWQATSRYHWDSFVDFLGSEINRLMPLFDKEGKSLSPNIDILPINL
jgi:hypothetical protein